MDLFIAVFVLPEVLMLALGFFAIIVSLAGSGEFDRFKKIYKPPGREVDPSYWGQYVKQVEAEAARTQSQSQSQPQVSAAVASPSSNDVTTSGIRLPKLLKEQEPVNWEKDWTGGPQ